MNTPQEIIAVVSAFVAGRTVQALPHDWNGELWEDRENPRWDFSRNYYRVKPDPKRLWVVEGENSAHLATSEAQARQVRNDLTNKRCTPTITEYLEVTTK